MRHFICNCPLVHSTKYVIIKSNLLGKPAYRQAGNVEVVMFVYQAKIKLHETDAAGLLFFSHQFKIIHDAYEALLERIGFGFAELIRKKDFFLPIVHAESDYKQPLFVGDLIEIHITVEKIGQTSFTFAYQIFDASHKLVGSARTIHVTMDKKTRKKIPIPPDMRHKIEELYAEDGAPTG